MSGASVFLYPRNPKDRAPRLCEKPCLLYKLLFICFQLRMYLPLLPFPLLLQYRIPLL